ncbi:CPBP family glutamic-type intramembrane protease [Modestobacter marinus]|uniref:CPBP family glutamic-type intramembrane protease n=1 Tax=Modestobacter marinus TaxID=477641 RepID=UPI001C94FF16|nr:CPBP family intramembrane glutamic endopeptidase [Modestobacter marinus]
MTTTPAATHPAGRLPTLRQRVARHPLTAFLVLTFGLAYPLVALPVLAAHGVLPGASLFSALHVAPDEVAGLLLTISLGTAAVTVTWAVDGAPGLRRLARRVVRWRVGWGWWLAALAGLPTAGLTLAVLVGDELRPVQPVGFLTGQVLALAVNLLLVNLWEEAAWSGVVQTRLEHRHGLLVAALLTAVPFALVHWPLALFGDPTVGSVAAALVAYLVLGALFRPMLAVFLRGGRGSVLLVAVLHSVFNRTNNGDGVLAGLTVHGGADGWAVLGATVVVTAGAALALRRRP